MLSSLLFDVLIVRDWRFGYIQLVSSSSTCKSVKGEEREREKGLEKGKHTNKAQQVHILTDACRFECESVPLVKLEPDTVKFKRSGH